MHGMPTRALLAVLTLIALACAPAPAGAADTVLVPGAQASRLTALDGTLVWIEGRYPSQTLMQRNPDGTVAPVKGTPQAAYFTLDLGRDARGSLVLTYAQCEGTSNCRTYSDDLLGRRSPFRRLAPNNCSLTSAPSRWGNRVAYGLACTKASGASRVADLRRSGLYVRTSPYKPRRMRMGDVRAAANSIRWVDLRGTLVGAAATGDLAFAFSQNIHGKHLRSALIGSSAGPAEASIAGVSLVLGGSLWSLVNARRPGDPNAAEISRIASARCSELERLANPTGPGEQAGFRAQAMAVDGATVYLHVPGTGIVVHPFAPARACV